MRGDGARALVPLGANQAWSLAESGSLGAAMRRSGLVQAALVLVGAVAAVSGGGAFRLRVLHTNDMHARFEEVSQSAGTCSAFEAANGLCYGGFARVAAALETELARAARENVSALSLNAGDSYQGTIWYTVYKWRVVSHFLKMLKIDAMALGNHEFDDGIEGLAPFLNDVGIPVLAANINFTREPEMLKTPIKSSMVVERGGRKIGIIGYLTPDTVVLADAGKLEFEDEIKSLREEAKKLKRAGVDIIIALGHSGYEVDVRIARDVEDVDLVVGGHSHTFLYTGTPPDSERPADVYPVMVTQRTGRKVAMVQAFAFTKYLGIVDLVFDERGELLEAKGNPILLDHTVVGDERVRREVVEWRSKLNVTLKQPVGKTRVLLDATFCRFFECNLGNLITDAYIHYAVENTVGPYWTKAAIAIQQAGGIRTTINASSTNGVITREDVITAMPFFSSLSLVRMKGRVLWDALTWSVSRYDPSLQWGRGEFLQVSGLKVDFLQFLPPFSRVQSVEVRCQDCRIPRYHKLSLEKEYNVIMPTFLFNGGDNFTMFALAGTEIERFDLPDTEVVIKYIQNRGHVYSGLEDRLVWGIHSSGSKLSNSLIFSSMVTFCLWFFYF